MSEFLTFLQLGFRHIVDVSAFDHILFLVALAAIYRFRDARNALWTISAFTVGHSITLALAVTGVLALPSNVIEFLIPVTIVITGIENLVVSDRTRAPWGGRYRPMFAGVFGLVHGAGFANYLKALFVERIAVPLFGFNVGIELGQIVVLVAAAGVLAGLDRGIAALRLASPRWPALRVRVVAVSLGVVAVGSVWAVERRPWWPRSAVLGGCAGAAAMHPLHSTITEVVADRPHGIVRATVRVFADDFGTAVRKMARGRTLPDAGPAWDAPALAYRRRASASRSGGARCRSVRAACGARATCSGCASKRGRWPTWCAPGPEHHALRPLRRPGQRRPGHGRGRTPEPAVRARDRLQAPRVTPPRFGVRHLIPIVRRTLHRSVVVASLAIWCRAPPRAARHPCRAHDTAPFDRTRRVPRCRGLRPT